MEFKNISVTEAKRVCTALFASHYEELATNKKLMKLDPDWDVYYKMESLKKILIIAAFEGNKIVGYSVNLLSNNLHYKDLFMCQNDILYIHPDYRKGRAGYQLIKETERQASELGCRFMLWHAKKDTALEQLMPRMDYKVQDIIFSKEI